PRGGGHAGRVRGEGAVLQRDADVRREVSRAGGRPVPDDLNATVPTGADRLHVDPLLVGSEGHHTRGGAIESSFAGELRAEVEASPAGGPGGALPARAALALRRVLLSVRA